MNTFSYFVIGYAVFLGMLFFYMFRLDRKQAHVKKMLEALHNQSQK